MIPSISKYSFILLAIAALGFWHGASAKFTDTCVSGGKEQWSLGPGGTLSAYCYNDACMTNDFTMLNLNDCFANSDGHIIPKKNGGFLNLGGGCSRCQKAGPVTVSCECRTLGNETVHAEVDLDAHIGNWKGNLECSGLISAWSAKPSWPCNTRDHDTDPTRSTTFLRTGFDLWQTEPCALTDPNLMTTAKLKGYNQTQALECMKDEVRDRLQKEIIREKF